MPASSQVDSIPASIIRQFIFCPRIPFYNEVLGINPGDRLWQTQGVDYHQRQAMLIKRHNLKQYGLEQPKIEHNVLLRSEILGIHGICDALLISAEELCVLEFKLNSTKAPHRGHVMQLAAYAMMAQEQYGLECRQMFVLYGTKGQTYKIQLTQELRSQVLSLVENIKKSLVKPLLPNSSASVGQCGQCEYFNFCADRND